MLLGFTQVVVWDRHGGFEAATVTFSWVGVIAATAAVAAAAFSGYNLWFARFRRGDLKFVASTIFYTSANAKKAKLLIPVTLWNSGATARVISNMMLRVTGADEPFTMLATRFRDALSYNGGKELHPGDDTDVGYFHPYAVGGQSADTRLVEFQYLDLRWEFASGRPLHAALEAKVDGREEWAAIGEVELRTDLAKNPAWSWVRNDEFLADSEKGKRRETHAAQLAAWTKDYPEKVPSSHSAN